MDVKNLTIEQRSLAIQRLTALWAFSESGLGGVLHALQVPFTGLVVGGLAIILITFISYFSQNQYNEVVKSLVIVLLVKAAVSPHTPFPAYIAVSFQAFLAYGLFLLFRINLLSILLLSILAMLESAVQKLLILTLFFGQSFWKAADELVAFISRQFSMHITNGSFWIIALYLTIYLAGGVITALMAFRLIKTFSLQNNTSPLPYAVTNLKLIAQKRTSRKKRIFILLFIAVFVSVVLFLLTPKEQKAFFTFSAIIWTLTAILLWYILLAPFFTKALQHILHKTSDKYCIQVGEILSFIPVLNQLTIMAWRSSKNRPSWQRIPVFLKTLLGWSLTYIEPDTKP